GRLPPITSCVSWVEGAKTPRSFPRRVTPSGDNPMKLPSIRLPLRPKGSGETTAIAPTPIVLENPVNERPRTTQLSPLIVTPEDCDAKGPPPSSWIKMTASSPTLSVLARAPGCEYPSIVIEDP